MIFYILKIRNNKKEKNMKLSDFITEFTLVDVKLPHNIVVPAPLSIANLLWNAISNNQYDVDLSAVYTSPWDQCKFCGGIYNEW